MLVNLHWPRNRNRSNKCSKAEKIPPTTPLHANAAFQEQIPPIILQHHLDQSFLSPGYPPSSPHPFQRHPLLRRPEKPRTLHDALVPVCEIPAYDLRILATADDPPCVELELEHPCVGLWDVLLCPWWLDGVGLMGLVRCWYCLRGCGCCCYH